METHTEMGNTEELDLAQERELVLQCQRAMLMRWVPLLFGINIGFTTSLTAYLVTIKTRRMSHRMLSSPYGKNIGKFEFRSRFSTWLYRIVKNKCFNQIDQHQRRKTDPMEIDDSQAWFHSIQRRPKMKHTIRRKRHSPQSTCKTQR